jgi:hypothetical protein
VNGSIRTILGSIIDYAGLFPPAGLDMCAAVANYAAYRAGRHAWMLGRFIVPASRLGEFESAAKHVAVSEPTEQAWRLSVLAGPDFASDLAAIVDFNLQHAAAFVVDTIELRATLPDEITRAMQRLPSELSAYFEVPVSSDESLFSAVRLAGARVKVRTGGVTAQAIPSSAELAGFLARAAAIGLAFKATAGLHHPVRSEQRLTYADDSPRGKMHGFLNVFLAAAGVRSGIPVAEVERLLDETSPATFHFDERGASWDCHRWSTDELLATRQSFAISFGSCSFQEPIDDLKGIGLL